MDHELAHRLATRLAQQRDEILRRAITTRLGRDDWSLDELRGRLTCFRDGTYRLDDRALVRFDTYELGDPRVKYLQEAIAAEIAEGNPRPVNFTVEHFS